MHRLYRRTGLYAHFRPTKVVWHRHFVRFVNGLRRGASVLDIACERFMNAAYFEGLRYTGADRDAEALAAGKELYPGDGHTAVRCDMRDPPFEADAFDYVVSTHSLSHLASPDDIHTAVCHFARIARERLFVTTPIRSRDLEPRLDDLLRTRFADVRKIRCGGLLTRAWEGTLFAHPQELPGWFVNAAAIPGTLLAWLDWLGPKGHLIYICNGKRSD